MEKQTLRPRNCPFWWFWVSKWPPEWPEMVWKWPLNCCFVAICLFCKNHYNRNSKIGHIPRERVHFRVHIILARIHLLSSALFIGVRWPFWGGWSELAIFLEKGVDFGGRFQYHLGRKGFFSYYQPNTRARTRNWSYVPTKSLLLGKNSTSLNQRAKKNPTFLNQRAKNSKF